MEAERREKIVHSYLENPLWSASRLAKQLKLPRNTVWRVIKRVKPTVHLTVFRCTLAVGVTRNKIGRVEEIKRKS